MGTLAEMLSTPLGVVEWFVYLLAAVMFVIGLHLMNSPKTARKGNMVSAIGMTMAVVMAFIVLFAGEVSNGFKHSVAVVVLIVGIVIGAVAGVIPLETVLELVFHRGSTMHHLIPRDEKGRSNYRMGALRPNQFGVGDDGVREYVESVSKASGEFLQIVNYNLAGQQYAVAGTIAGLKALKADSARRVAEYGGKPAFMLVPGIDVPFHSTLLRKGVPEFRDKLDALLPKHIDYRGRLVGRYIPNLVAVPFEMTKEFAAKILEVVPSERIKAALDDPKVWDSYAEDDQKLGRLLLTELLSWQFASPVRWIETQALLFGSAEQGGLGVEAITIAAACICN